MSGKFQFIAQNKAIVGILFLIAFAGTLNVGITPVFAVSELGATPFESSLYVVVPAVLSMLLVPIIGRWSDRMGAHRSVMVAGIVWQAIGSFLLAGVQDVFQFVLVAAIFFSMFAVPASQTFTLARQTLALKGPVRNGDVSLLRIGYVAGWVVGPAGAGLLIALGFSFRSVFFAQAVIYACVAAVAWSLFRQQSDSGRKTAREHSRTKHRTTIELKLLLIIIACVLSGDVVRTASLPLVITGYLGGAAYQVSIAFSLVPLVEIPVTLAVIAMANRFGDVYALLVGIVSAAVYFGTTPFADNIETIYLLQLVYAFIPAATMGIGVAYAQSLSPNDVGAATSAVFGAQSSAILIGSLVVSLGALSIGPRLSFFVPCFFVGAAFLAAALLMWQKRPRDVPAADL